MTGVMDVEYGDNFGYYGYAINALRQFPHPTKIELGWMPPSNIVNRKSQIKR